MKRGSREFVEEAVSTKSPACSQHPHPGSAIRAPRGSWRAAMGHAGARSHGGSPALNLGGLGAAGARRAGRGGGGGGTGGGGTGAWRYRGLAVPGPSPRGHLNGGARGRLPPPAPLGSRRSSRGSS